MLRAHSQFFVIIIACVAALGGLLFGFDTGVISGAILFISPKFQLTDIMKELVIGAVLFGALLGSILSGWVSDYFGRRRLLIFLGGVFIIGTLLTAVAANVNHLLIGRIIVGIAIGISSFTVPLYLAELSPTQYRGALVSINQLAITIGIFISYFVDYWFGLSGDWRWMFGVGVIPAVGLLIGTLFLPESPRWLMLKGLRGEATRVLMRIRSAAQTNIDHELNEIETTIQREKGDWRILFQKWVRPALIIGFGMAFLQQATGINAIIYYAPTVLQMAGFHAATGAISATAIVGIVNVLATLIALPLLDSVGRRPLLLVGLTGMAIGLGTLSFAFHHVIAASPILKWFALGSMILYIACFAFSLGVICWLLIAEVFPLKIRGMGTSFAVAATWAINMLISTTFLTLVNALGISATYLLYAVICVAGWIFVYTKVPETRGLSLERIEMNLLAGKKGRALGE